MFKKTLVLILNLLFILPLQAANAGSITRVVEKFDHRSSAGGQATESIKLTAPQGRQCAAFNTAELQFSKRRYGKANIVSKPKKGCNPAKNACYIKIKWEHKPAGRLSYKLKVKWDTDAGC